MEEKAAPADRRLLGATMINASGTLASRLLGMLRDMATAALLGMSAGGVMDAFALAFRVPNLFRRLFGEGAMTASYLPVFSRWYERDPKAAWKLASAAAVWLGMILLGLLVFGELGCAWVLAASDPSSRTHLTARLLAIMMPYMLFICLTALMAATLHARGRFAVPALVPAVLNIVWLAGVLLAAPRLAKSPEQQAVIVAFCIFLAGGLQLVVQMPVLRSVGFRFDYDWAVARSGISEIARSMLPMTLGLMVTQINTLLDSLIAWGLSAPSAALTHSAGIPIAWLGGRVDYPMQQGAAAAVYYGERLYQFPLGLLGIAVATAVFPLLARHAARGESWRFGEDLTLGLRLVVVLAIPAGVGLVLLGHPLAVLLFQRGQFTADDALRTGRMIALYGAGVWAYCALPVVVRGYYATADRTTPVVVGAVAAVLNLGLNLVLIWPMAEGGLALATTVSAAVQLVFLMGIFTRRHHALAWSPLAAATWRAVAASLFMGIAGSAVLTAIPADASLAGRAVRVALPLAVCLVAYALAFHTLGGRELVLLLRRKGEHGATNDS